MSDHERHSDPNPATMTLRDHETDTDLQNLSLGAYAHHVVQKNYRKFIKHEKSFCKDNDPEALHQMRVSIRRLRTALECFQQVLDWPSAAKDKRLKTIANTLGALRDLDVLQETLQKRYVPHLSPDEQDPMGKVMAKLTRKRAKRLRKVHQLLASKPYKSVKRSIEAWLNQPTYDSAIADWPLQRVLSDLVTPLIGHLLVHPGWMFETHIQAGEFRLNSIAPAEVNQLLESKGATLHGLRKQMKRVRYQTEFFSSFFSEEANNYLQEFKTMQDQLGYLQDCAVLRAFLHRCLKNWPEKLHTVHHQMQQDEASAWIEWRSQQFHYLKPEVRHHLRIALISDSISSKTSQPLSLQPNPPEMLPVLPVG